MHVRSIECKQNSLKNNMKKDLDEFQPFFQKKFQKVYLFILALMKQERVLYGKRIIAHRFVGCNVTRRKLYYPQIGKFYAPRVMQNIRRKVHHFVRLVHIIIDFQYVFNIYDWFFSFKNFIWQKYPYSLIKLWHLISILWHFAFRKL